MLSTMGKQDPLTNTYSFECPYCHQHYRAPESFLGKTICCKSKICQKEFLLLRPEEEKKQPVFQQEESSFANILEGNITCPHCWHTFSAEDVLRISVHPDLLGDPILGEMEQKRFIPALFNADGIPLDEKGMPCPDMACPHCRLPFPETIINMESNYISIVGAPSSGKTYYLTTLVHELRKTLPTRSGYSFSDIDPRINKTLNEYEDLMFMAADKKKVVTLLKTEQIGPDFSDQTVLNGLPINLPKPFIFQQIPLSSTDGNENQGCNIIFYDNAGEHFQPRQEQISNPATLHLAHSNAIFFIFDPLNDSEMREICNQSDPQINDASKLSNQTILFSEMVSRIKRHAKHDPLNTHKRSQIPLVILVGKYDAWENQFPYDLRNCSPFKINEHTYEMEFDEDILYIVSYELRSLLNRFAPGLISQAEAFFDNVICVPVSSFGSLAESSCNHAQGTQNAVGVLPAKLKPVWADIPYYAIMNHFGLLRKSLQDNTGTLPLTGNLINDKVTIIHPQMKQKEQLPLNYAGHCIRIGGQKYRLPGNIQTRPAGNTKPKDYWN